MYMICKDYILSLLCKDHHILTNSEHVLNSRSNVAETASETPPPQKKAADRRFFEARRSRRDPCFTGTRRKSTKVAAGKLASAAATTRGSNQISS